MMPRWPGTFVSPHVIYPVYAYMIQEQQPQHSKKTQKSDLRVHACLYFIRSTGYAYVRFTYSSLGLN
jgi:hypothetical protein